MSSCQSRSTFAMANAFWLGVVTLSLAGLVSSAAVGVLPRVAPPYDEKSFVFVVGAHHSGTTLMDLILCQHSDVACIESAPVPQNEGQHLQNIYPAANKIGGVEWYAFEGRAHMTEADPLLTVESRKSLLDAWSPYWNLTASVLVEKSPRHATMTRFLQALFEPEQTAFITTLRHPLACAHYQWGKWLSKGKRKKGDQLKSLQDDCGERYIQHWLQIQRTLFLTDSPYLERLLVVPFELFLGEGMSPPQPLEVSERRTQRMTNALFRFIGVEPTVRLEFIAQGEKPEDDDDDDDDDNRRSSRSDDDDDDNGKSKRSRNDDDDDDNGKSKRSRNDDDDDDNGKSKRSRNDDDDDDNSYKRNGRRLLQYHGSWHHVRLQHGSVFSWVNEWNDLVNVESKACRRVVAFYEEEVNKFGYSLVDLTQVHIPELVLRLAGDGIVQRT